MTGIQFVTDEQGRKVGVLIDLKKTRRYLGGLLGRPCILNHAASKRAFPTSSTARPASNAFVPSSRVFIPQ
jgi:hypothetical protein